MLLEHARPGQFVHRGNDDEIVRGFISEVDYENERVLIVLFQPVEVKPFATVVYKQVSEDFWVAKLRKALDANPDIKEQWREVLANG